MPWGNTLTRGRGDDCGVGDGRTAEIAAAGHWRPPWWAFRSRSHLPTGGRQSAGVPNEIDASFSVNSKPRELHPAPEADRRSPSAASTSICLGRPPIPEAVKDFVESTTPRLREPGGQTVRRFPGVGALGRHWLDLPRYADTNGIRRRPGMAAPWRYRDYSSDAFNHDKPSTKFVKEQIAETSSFRVVSAVRGAPRSRKRSGTELLRGRMGGAVQPDAGPATRTATRCW